ncbi:hypothetical protein Pla111_14890 [Botrimarina hoheduenensis]|uniref:Uncharacterized protein n=1 Tax=Botrimarina hoheduenensis TaxID=2528000 RepID=A0A5C5W807_9BACT|nr:hypothetical protein Pla111_14890 [Botrimarina hoheduenensis]
MSLLAHVTTFDLPTIATAFAAGLVVGAVVARAWVVRR